MSAEARVAKLEALLARVHQRRRPTEGASAAAAADEPVLDMDEAEEPITTTRAAAKPVPATPMEQALSGELDDDEPELEIVMDVDDDDEPELVLEDTPTAPVGTRAPRGAAASPTDATRPLPSSKRAATPKSPASPQPSSAHRAAPAAPLAANAPRPVSIDAPTAVSAPVARAVSQPEPTTFGDLLKRTLALRPR